ncbi:MAG: hypothetical protein H7838_13935, partial [Magnetococcus sp. DMHC-8]
MSVPHSAQRFADAITLEEAVIPWKIRLALLSAIGASIAFGLWAMTTQIDEAVKATGQFVPKGTIYRVQSVEAGI